MKFIYYIPYIFVVSVKVIIQEEWNLHQFTAVRLFLWNSTEY